MPEHNPVRHRFTDYGKDRHQIQKFMVNITDVFDLGWLYQMMHEWLVEERWCSRDDSSFGEKYFLLRDDPTMGKEYYIRWRLEKAPTGAKFGAKEQKFFSFIMDVNFHILFLQKAEIMHKGQKVKLNRGEVEVDCTTSIIVDREGAWKKSILRPFKDLYLRRVLVRDFSRMKHELNDDSLRFRDAIASYLKLETYLAETEGTEFWSTRTLE